MTAQKLSAFRAKLTADHQKTYEELSDLSANLNLDLVEKRLGNLASYTVKLARSIEVFRAQEFALNCAKNCKTLAAVEDVLEKHLMLAIRSTSPDDLHYKSQLARILDALRKH